MTGVRRLLVAGLVSLLSAAAGIGGAGATPLAGSAAGPPLAGGHIDLSQGWGQATACMVPPSGEMECFDTVAALKARSAQLRAATPASSGCPVDLYTGSYMSGWMLELWGQGYWINLVYYGFDNATVSFVGNGCGFHLADYAWGGGYWYPGYTGPWAYAWDMGWSWDWRVSSVYIN
jgi:hypothetical protein